MKHIKLFENFINERISKSELTKIENWLYKLDGETLRMLADDYGVEDEDYQDNAYDFDLDDLVGFILGYVEDMDVSLKDLKDAIQ